MQRLTVILRMLGMLAWSSAMVLAAQKVAASPPSASQPASQPASRPATQPDKVTEKLIIAGEEFSLEIAADEAARENGLMDRDWIDNHGGMMFIWPAAESRSFWMKNCPIDIDLMFLDSNGRIVAVHAMVAEPAQRVGESDDDYSARLKLYPSRKPAQFAVELKAGSIKRLKLTVGQTVTLDRQRCEEHLRPATSAPER